MPLDVVVEFKRGVYEMALTELARFLPRAEHRNRYLRGGVRPRDQGALPPIQTTERRERGPSHPPGVTNGNGHAHGPQPGPATPPGLEIES